MLAVMAASDEEVREFFERYAVVARAADPEPLASMYAPAFLVAGPQGSATFTNDARFREWLRGVAAAHEARGMRSLAVADVELRRLSPIHLLAEVTWDTRFEKTGDRPITLRIAYLLERADDGLRVLAYVSEADEAAEMKRLGLA
jgi:hypothetical protein